MTSRPSRRELARLAAYAIGMGVLGICAAGFTAVIIYGSIRALR